MSLDLKLDEDFLFILNFARNSMHLFQNRPEDRAIIESWFEKLCLEVYRGIDAKRLRNLYLVKLVTCIQSGALLEPFREKPHGVGLDPLPPEIVPSNMDEPPWLAEFDAAAAEMTPGTAKDFSSYVCSRVLENGRGICAYVAVSVADEGEKPKWFEMGSGRPLLLSGFDAEIDKAYEKMIESTVGTAVDEEPAAFIELAEDVIIAIQEEESGLTGPDEHPGLEKFITEFKKHVRGKPMEWELLRYSHKKRRAMLLSFLQKKLQDQVDEIKLYLH
ncbi:uncharacterized protein LOC131683116 [Topomyia yanbarensis]|uniref:uncharacterized protein LOC131683097 n=1 Tax=Topomyia yanbarensis TaxID=2498891 RepID=UPI00273B2BB2|nr:uncharacterized protein LOC131683097 [Topomyia yanbarensis]XP_058820913.1 uncharacterized protein LOC131683116 [Topomyia yanbarensis]